MAKTTLTGQPGKDKKDKGSAVDLTARVKAKVLKKGAEFKHNSWKEGQEVTIGKILAESFQEKGYIKIIDGTETSNLKGTSEEEA